MSGIEAKPKIPGEFGTLRRHWERILFGVTSAGLVLIGYFFLYSVSSILLLLILHIIDHFLIGLVCC